MRLAGPILAMLIPVLQAGPGGYRSFPGIGDAAAYAVGTVERVVRLAPSSPCEHHYELHAQVRRAYPRTLANRITVLYTSADFPTPWNCSGGGGNGPPPLRAFEKGQTILFTLTPAKGGWTLGDWIPALPGNPSFGTPPRTGREFFLRDLANTLTRAPIAQRVTAARLLSDFIGDIPPELPRYLRASLGSNDDAWLETGCVFLGLWGVPAENQAELTYGEASPPFHRLREVVTWMLWKGDRRDYPNRLIRCLLRNAAVYHWGAANALMQYKDSTVFLDGVTAAMRRSAPGSLTIASAAAKAGKEAVLPDALDLAVRLVQRVVLSPVHELQPAAQLILTYGDAARFHALVAALVRFKWEDENFYRDLWGASAYGQNPRELALAAVLLDDKRPGFVTLRYCDVAAYAVQRLSGQDFGTKRDMSPAERDATVARAAVWLAAHPVTRDNR